MSSFRNCMMLYRPSLSVWTGRKKDKAQSEKANADAGAVDGAANVYKALLPDSPELLAVQKAATAFRSWVYNTTLPWDDNGGRVARVEKHMEFMTEAGDRIRAMNDLVEEFIGSYDRSIEEARFKLNGMFNQSDYPTAFELRRRFAFHIECEAVPNSADFRIIDGLPQDEVDRLVNDAQDGVERRINAAMADAHERLLEVVVKMATTLKQYGNKEIKKFNDTLITNIQDLCAVMPALNLTNDKRLTEIARQAERLATYDLRDLRSMPEVRDAAIAEATALIAFADNQPGFKGAITITKDRVTTKTAEEVAADGAVFGKHGTVPDQPVFNPQEATIDNHAGAGTTVDDYPEEVVVKADMPGDINPASLADGW